MEMLRIFDSRPGTHACVKGWLACFKRGATNGRWRAVRRRAVGALVCLAATLALAAPAYGSASVSGTMLRDYALHLVFWIPPGATLDSAVEPGMLRMETDIQAALAAGRDGNIFSVPGDYTDANGRGDPRIASIDTTTDTDAVASDQTGTACQNAPPPCVTETQLNQEVSSLAANRGWLPGTHTLVLVVLASQVNVCGSIGFCTPHKFAGYHGNTAVDPTTGAVIGYTYVVIPTVGNENDLPFELFGAEVLTGHEQNEAIVDPSGYYTEIADPCRVSPGANEINGHEYLLPYLQLPSGVCSLVSVFRPTLNAHFTITQVPVKGGSLVTFTPASNEDPGGDLINDGWSNITPTLIQGGGQPVTHLFTKPGEYSIGHEIEDLGQTYAMVRQNFTRGPNAGDLRRALARVLIPSGPAASLARLRRAGYRFTFAAPCAGRLVVSWSAMDSATRRRVELASVSLAARKAGRVAVRLPLRAGVWPFVAHAARITLTANGTFIPRGAPAITATRTATLPR